MEPEPKWVEYDYIMLTNASGHMLVRDRTGWLNITLGVGVRIPDYVVSRGWEQGWVKVLYKAEPLEPDPPAEEPKCEWFQWIGGSVCDNCGQSCSRHRGIAWHISPFDPSGKSEVHVPWSHYGPDRDLNIPLFTQCLRPDDLAYLQQMEDRHDDLVHSEESQ